MRIISGSRKGKIIKAPSQLPVRPTTDYAKESFFNILNNLMDPHEISFLDLFSGTGNFAYEMASRGCTRVTAVDVHGPCVKFIQKTATNLTFDGIHAVREDALRYLRGNRSQFDVIFADPPYEYESYDLLIALVLEHDRLTPDGMLVLEHSPRTSFEGHPHLFDFRKYGNVCFSFFQAEPVDPSPEA
jgi:16S rRNA (guanine966-N2)-methyltransferase